MKKTVLDWLNYMQSIHVSAIDMGLERVLPVANSLNLLNLARDKYIFTVAGTNGKGSTTAVIAEICTQANYTTGLYQSPHLVEFNERIQIAGRSVDDAILINAFEQVDNARRDCDISLSFFEMTTLSALLIFAQSECDVWVLEVGLGGRLDVVNIIDPHMTVITNISIDHVDWLGDDREVIGYEKAGILREGVPLVFGDQDMPDSVATKITELDVPVYQQGIDYNYQHITHNDYWTYCNQARTMHFCLPQLSLINVSNAVTAVVASKLDINYSHISTAMHHITLAGRFDYQQQANRRWLFDVAHNEAGVKFLLQQLHINADTMLLENGDVHLVFSMLKDKDIDMVVRLISNNELLKTKNIYWHIASINPVHYPRSADIETLYHAIVSHVDDSLIYQYDNLAQATQSVITVTNMQDLILVVGSFHTICESLLTLDCDF